MRWTYKPEPDTLTTAALAEALGVDSVVAGLLVQRGVDSFEKARRFFRPSWEDLHDPFEMAGMEEATARILQAFEKKERILVYGDYDVDGTSSVALLTAYLRDSGAAVAYYIPDRYREGYGLSVQGIDFAADNGMGLIIALDCGIKALDQAAYARSLGVDLIICDHHRPGPELPEAVAVLDPKRPDCKYLYKELCGCGVGFKLLQALQMAQGLPETALRAYLDLVAVAIAADIVPLTGENRVLTAMGLQVLRDSPRPGLRALMAETDPRNFQVSDLVFRMAPRINAAGRMEHGEQAVQLLVETDTQRAAGLAERIEALNTNRRETDQRITEEALGQIALEGSQQRHTTVVYHPDWHKGVIGIVASRLMESYYRPTLVFTRNGDTLAASARSVRGFDIYQALEACSDCIEQFGGHTYAAGLTLDPDRLGEFRERFEEVVRSSIQPGSLEPEVAIDRRLHLRDISPKLLRILQQFGPFGPGNPRPVFSSGPLRDTGYAKQVGSNRDHLKFRVRQGGALEYGAIGFGMGEHLHLVRGGQDFELAYSLEENHWNGRTEIQLKARAIKPWKGVPASPQKEA